jgi:hypothetical protein
MRGSLLGVQRSPSGRCPFGLLALEAHTCAAALRRLGTARFARRRYYPSRKKNSQFLAVFFYACNFLLILVLIGQRQMREERLCLPRSA